MQAGKRSRQEVNKGEANSHSDGSEEEGRSKKHYRADALTASKAQPVALVTSKRVSIVFQPGLDCSQCTLVSWHDVVTMFAYLVNFTLYVFTLALLLQNGCDINPLVHLIIYK